MSSLLPFCFETIMFVSFGTKSLELLFFFYSLDSENESPTFLLSVPPWSVLLAADWIKPRLFQKWKKRPSQPRVLRGSDLVHKLQTSALWIVLNISYIPTSGHMPTSVYWLKLQFRAMTWIFCSHKFDGCCSRLVDQF